MLTSNLQQVQQRIEQAIKKHHGSENVQLLAVSKTKPVEMIEEVYQQGQILFGENYLQESIEKIKQLNNPALEWHFIGAIQSNKAKEIAQNFHWVHTVERLKVAKKLNQYAQHKINICIQVNISLEPSKSGCLPEQTLELAQQITLLENINLRGLMVIPKPQETFELQKIECQKAKKLLDELNDHGFKLDTLSMGMSNDLEAAIASGSTMVRIGTDIFGSRQ